MGTTKTDRKRNKSDAVKGHSGKQKVRTRAKKHLILECPAKASFPSPAVPKCVSAIFVVFVIQKFQVEETFGVKKT